MRCSLWLILFAYCFAFSMVDSAFAQRSFGDRLEQLTAAVQKHGGSFVANPVTHAKVAWIFFDAGEAPDAIVVLRKSASDCAAQYNASVAPCLGLVFLGQPDGSFAPVTSFPYAGQFVYFSPRSQAGRALYFSDKNAPEAPYDRFTLESGRLKGAGQALKASEFAAEVSLAFTDQSMDTISTLKYADANFQNAGARLAPFRVQVDEINARYPDVIFIGNDGVSLSRAPSNEVRAVFANNAKLLNTKAIEFLQRLTERLAWPVQLNARLWVCNDWMVPRAFWTTESRGIADIGVCLDPLVYAQYFKQNLGDNKLWLDATTFRLLQEAGSAFFLRGEFLSLKQREALLRSEEQSSAGQIAFFGALISAVLAHDSKLMNFEQMIAQEQMWPQLTAFWFDYFESRVSGYFQPTSELRRWERDHITRIQGIACARDVLIPRGEGDSNSSAADEKKRVACPKEFIDTAKSIVESARGKYTR